MLNSDSYGMIGDMLVPESFYEPKNRLVYTAIVELATKQAPIDMRTVTEQLQLNGTLNDVGGPIYVANLTASVNSAAHLHYHAQIVADKYLARQLIKFSTEIERSAYEGDTQISDLMQKAEADLFKISQKNLKSDYSQIDPVIEEALKKIEAASNKSGINGVPSGFVELDKITSGWQAPDLIIIAARPAMGKTAFVLSMAKNMAEKGHAVVLFSLEMSKIQLVNRLLVNVSELPGDKIKNGTLSSSEWEQLNSRTKKLQGMPIYLDDTPSLSVFEFNTKARRLVKEHNVECIIIDYLQLMNASGMGFGSREQEVSMISRSLKQLAKELNIPIIALSQLNRGVEGRTGADKRPQLADLRESGAIEQDADMVLFIHRPEYYKIFEDANGNDLHGMAEIIIAKHRNGATADVRLVFKSELAKFMNPDEVKDNVEKESSIFGGDGEDADAADFVAGSAESSAPAPSADEVPF